MSFTTRRITSEHSKRSVPWGSVFRALKIATPIVGWYIAMRERRKEREEQTRHWVFIRNAIIILIALACTGLLFTGVVKALQAMQILNLGSILTAAGAELPVDQYNHTNLLLLGQGDETGEDLTDSIMIASIDQGEPYSVALLSLPRDLYFLDSEDLGKGKGKINSMYRDQKINLERQGLEEDEASLQAIQDLASTIESKMNIELHYVVKVDFDGFVKVVDAMGGVDIEVPYDIVDTTYPGPNYTYETFEIRAGMQHIDGETALKYVRSRHTTSDFGRSARQQQLLTALAHQAKEAKLLRRPSTVTKLFEIAGEHLETDMTLREMIGLAGILSKASRDHVITMQLNDRNALYDGIIEPGGFLYTPPRDLFDGMSVLLPVSIPEFPVTWKQPRTLRSLLIDQRTGHLLNPTISILNAGARSGMARRLGTELTRYGYTVENIANASTGDQEESFIAAQTDAEQASASFFAKTLQMPSSLLPENLRPDEVAQVTIVLGEDYSYQPLQSLLDSQ